MRLDDELPATALLFGEDHGRVVVSASPADEAEVREMAARHGVPCAPIGTVGEEWSSLRIHLRGESLELSLGTLADRYFGAIPRAMNEA